MHISESLISTVIGTAHI